jgi:hypothetical protein
MSYCYMKLRHTDNSECADTISRIISKRTRYKFQSRTAFLSQNSGCNLTRLLEGRIQ